MNETTAFGRVMSALLDALFTLVLALTVIASVIVFMNRGQVGFGALGIIQSPSMVSGGYAVGDVVFAKNGEDYAVGDVIVFYRAPNLYKYRADELEKEELLSYPVWIHEVIQVSTDELGRKTYLTKGTDNSTDDTHFVPHDFVLGKARKTPALFGELVRFIYSVKGIICTVIIPCGIMFIYLTWDLIMLLTVETVEKPKRAVRYQKKSVKAQSAIWQVEEQSSSKYYFLGRLFTADKKTRKLYSELKNILLGYENVRPLVIIDYEEFLLGDKTLGYLDIRGETVYLSTMRSRWKITDSETLKNAIFELREEWKALGLTRQNIPWHDYSITPEFSEELMAELGWVIA
ncbi:MAG: hypothetical protein IKL76_03480 [Clostridia bacterium]|nr:hypothetical protein [Clostridia bacterium]